MITEITAIVVGLTGLATAVAALVPAILSAYVKARESLALIKQMQMRLDDHSRRITNQGTEITMVAQAQEPQK